jgi:hypothetical protein
MTPARKRRQMLGLVSALDAARADFNAALLGMRERKRGLLHTLAGLHARLRAMDKELGLTGAWGYGVGGGHACGGVYFSTDVPRRCDRRARGHA